MLTGITKYSLQFYILNYLNTLLRYEIKLNTPAQ